MGNPLAEPFGRRMMLQQVSKQLAWAFDKEPVFSVAVENGDFVTRSVPRRLRTGVYFPEGAAEKQARRATTGRSESGVRCFVPSAERRASLSE